MTASKEEIKVKFGGKIKTYKPMELPIGIAMKVFEMTAASKNAVYFRVRGSVYYAEAIRDPQDMKTANECWAAAELQGAEVSELFLLTEN